MAAATSSLTPKARLRAYYYLTKPGIIRGNILTATAGFLLAAKDHIAIGLLLVTLSGLALVIAAACVSNNILDRGIDKRMARTAKRALVNGRISVRGASVYAAILLTIGSCLLFFYVNLLTLVLALMGYIAYVAIYGYYKRRSTLGTAVGSISGAIPPVVGYVAVSNHIDAAAVILFVILVCWQMPHFFAIAMYRLKDYASAELPVLPVKKGLLNTKIQCLIYITLYGGASLALTVKGYTGTVYAACMGIICVVWLGLSIQGFYTQNNEAWARKLFFFSLIAITIQCLLIGATALLD